MRKLIIVESPNKVKTIKKIIKELQSNGDIDKKIKFEVESSVGHILELPKSWMPDRGGEFSWDVSKKVITGKGDVVKNLTKLAKDADEVLVATDPDREGEAIADDLVSKLKIEDKYHRMTFQEITSESLLNSYNSLKKVDENAVNAQRARLIIDRVFGYKLSEWTRKKFWNTEARSAGRVQSPTLKLVVERELLIEAFNPESFFRVEQVINDEVIATINLHKDMVDNKPNQLSSEKYAEYKEKLTGTLEVKEVNVSTLTGKTKIPFKQSSVYKVASSAFGMSAAAARSAMQSLFEQGLISYPRTDSTRYSQSFIDKAQSFIAKKYGKEYIANEVKGSKSGAQDAHEALRITDPSATPDIVEKDLKNVGEKNMYRMIYNHTLQTLMVPPKRESLTYILEDSGVEFKMSSSKVIYDGYLIVSGWEKGLELPKLIKGDIVKSKKINFTQDETKPKSRFNEGSLIAEMEKVGIGRPSTFSSTVSTLLKRGYIEKKGNALRATRIGKATAITLMLFFGNIIKEEYTMEFEQVLDQIAEGQREKMEVMQGFWDHLQEELSIAKIKTKYDSQEATQYIDLSKLSKKSHIVSDTNIFAREYAELMLKFLTFAKFSKKEIEIDYKAFVKDCFENFQGPIVMPKEPKRGAYIIVNGNIEDFDPSKDYVGVEMCPVCGKYPLVYRGGISRRNQIYWAKTCSGWPKVKCKLENNFINQKEEPELFNSLENRFIIKHQEWEEEESKHVQDLTQEIDLSNDDSTIHILLEGYKK